MARLSLYNFIYWLRAQMHREKAEKPTVNHGIVALEATVFNFFSTQQESKYCFCQVCLHNSQQKEKGKDFLKQSNSMFKIDSAKMKKFYQFLSNIDQKIYFKLQISELCFFQGGEGRVIFKSKSNGIHQINIGPQMRKQIPNFFVQSKKYVKQGQMVVSENINHIKLFEAVVPSYKHGLSNDNLDNKPKNYTFHSNIKEFEESHLVIPVHQFSLAEVAVIKYKDKDLELVNEKELRIIMKSNVKTQSIQIIQSYIKPHEKESQFIFSEYVEFRKPQNVLMYNRSLIQIKTQIGILSKFSKEYIPLQYLQEYEQMLKETAEEFCLYQTYKMCHYMEINRDIRIKNLTTVWIRDQVKEITFFGVAMFEYQINEKIFEEKVTIEDLQEINKNNCELTHLQKEMLNLWQNVKRKKGLTVTTDHSNKQKELVEQIERLKKTNINNNSKMSSRSNSPAKSIRK